MKHTPIVPSLVVAAAAAISMLVPSPSAAGPRPPVGATDKKPVAQAPAPSVPDEYRMSAGDKLRIEVYKDPQLSQSVQVRPDGKITLPLIGDIVATGRTPIELRDTIGAALKEYVTNPTVTVIVVEATTATAYVMGEVNHPGAVNLSAPLTVLQALAIAGGLKDFANAKNIRILRKDPAGMQMITFNYKDALKSAQAPVYLRAGDTVVVPD
jgi:polysaccharide export outer membrane protein